MALFGAVVGAVAGGVFGGVSSYMNAKRMSRAYKDLAKAKQQYAQSVRTAANEYSGQKGYNRLQNAGDQEGLITNQRGLGAQVAQQNQSAGALMGNAAGLEGNYLEGYNSGVDNQATNLNARFDADTAKSKANVTKAEAALQQMGVNVGATNEAIKGGLNTASGLASLYKDLKGSDENVKEPINNESGLPESDIEDSMRQLETIKYQYKDPSVPGCDDEKHDSGFTAQSAEKTPLFETAVNEGADGVKRIDQWKLLEAVTAGIAQLQREIDELEGQKATSDETCKTCYEGKNGFKFGGF